MEKKIRKHQKNKTDPKFRTRLSLFSEEIGP